MIMRLPLQVIRQWNDQIQHTSNSHPIDTSELLSNRALRSLHTEEHSDEDEGNPCQWQIEVCLQAGS